MSSAPLIGLLLDVDGPIANPAKRAIIEPTIVPDLLTLAAAGIPVVYNTGRSADFIQKQVFTPLLAAGIPKNARIHAICEKGAVWLTLFDDGHGDLTVDPEIIVPKGFPEAIEAVINERYSATTFYDDTKLAMVSTEQNHDTSSEDYYRDQVPFVDEAFELLLAHGQGVETGDRATPNADGNITYRIEPTIISTDIESVLLGKDRGAMRALELLKEDGALPQQWRTVGDSPSDYKMSDWLYEQGQTVKHVDVRPVDGKTQERPYPVLGTATTTNDEAGAKYLRWVVGFVDGTASEADEQAFDA